MSTLSIKKMKKLVFFYLILVVMAFAGCERLTIPVNNSENIPPAVPTNLSIFYASDGEVILNWRSNNESDLLGYNIYKRTNKTNFVKIDFTANNYYYDLNLDYNETYYYKISAINNDNLESLQSDSVTAQPINRYKPALPKYLAINARNWQGNLSVFLKWRPNYEYDIKQYNIYRGTTQSFEADSLSLTGSSGNFFYEDTSQLHIGTIYYYKVRAVDKGGLISESSTSVSDEIYPMAELISPINNSLLEYITQFKFLSLPFNATYKLVVQTNEYSGEIWSKTFQSDISNDTINVDFDFYGIEYGTKYYWRVLTYSNNGTDANSISPLATFILKP